MDLATILEYVRAQGASDLHLVPGFAPMMRIDGQMTRTDGIFEASDYIDILRNLMSDRQNDVFDSGKDVDFSHEDKYGNRYRVNIFRREGKMACVMRALNETIPTMEKLGLPEVFKDFAMLPRGLVLVTGPTGSGKSTSLASMIDYANQRRKCHILTAEDPIEYRYQSKQALINQREIGQDIDSFAGALRSALREDPDVILVGEMRDFETISAAVTAAETGHLVFSTLHTTGAAKTVDRIIDVFPSSQQQQIKAQLGAVMKAVITQTLVPRIGGGRVAAFEVLVCNDAVLNMIREGKTFQLDSAIQTGAKEGMILLDRSLANLVVEGKITMESAMEKCVREDELKRFVQGMGRGDLVSAYEDQVKLNSFNSIGYDNNPY
ncbi:MAG: type IV pilus twitching motility protein PilT [Firmicutes bacterium]|nr:type IV pilus twitching motility protein PilT [Bacillota bacterium]